MADLFSKQQQASGSVECLGQTFPSDRARREYFMKLLAEKLQDPVFRQIEGFPQGTDEAILAMSDPPYYTACPNPFLAEFVRIYGQSMSDSDGHTKEPFASDVSEGRHTWLYKAHAYHTKVPPKAIQKYLEHYTRPGDIALDAFRIDLSTCDSAAKLITASALSISE